MPEPVRLLAVDAPTGVEQVERGLVAGDERQRHRQAEAVVEAEPGEVGGEAGVGAGDAEVGRHRQAEPAADRRPLHGGDDRDRLLEQPDRHVVEVRAAGAPLATAGEVGAGAEVPAVAGEHDGPAARRRRAPRRRRRSTAISATSKKLFGGRRISTSGDVPVALDSDVTCTPGHAARSTRRPRRAWDQR